MKPLLLGFLATIALLLGAVVGYLQLGFAEARADVRAPAWQSGLMQFAVHASVRRRAPRIQSPVPHTDEELIAGGKLYLDGCAGCHGRPGRARRKHIIRVPGKHEIDRFADRRPEMYGLLVQPHELRSPGRP